MKKAFRHSIQSSAKDCTINIIGYSFLSEKYFLILNITIDFYLFFIKRLRHIRPLHTYKVIIITFKLNIFLVNKIIRVGGRL